MFLHRGRVETDWSRRPEASDENMHGDRKRREARIGQTLRVSREAESKTERGCSKGGSEW